MPAISRRRGSAASFFGGAAGLPFCSGGNLRTGSAILLFFLGEFLLGRLVGWILDRVADVLLDRLQLGQQAVRIGGIDAVERGRGEFGTKPGELAEQRPRGLAQIEAVDAAVAVVAAAFDP